MVKLSTTCGTLKLNLISEEGYFLLDQNNFSAAHPVVGTLDEHEFLAFLNRCAKHALTNERNPVGVDLQAFIDALKAGRFSRDQLDTWRTRVSNTFEAQREALIGMLHGIYCDPGSGEEARVNALAVCDHFKASLREGEMLFPISGKKGKQATAKPAEQALVRRTRANSVRTFLRLGSDVDRSDAVSNDRNKTSTPRTADDTALALRRTAALGPTRIPSGREFVRCQVQSGP